MFLLLRCAALQHNTHAHRHALLDLYGEFERIVQRIYAIINILTYGILFALALFVELAGVRDDQAQFDFSAMMSAIYICALAVALAVFSLMYGCRVYRELRPTPRVPSAQRTAYGLIKSEQNASRIRTRVGQVVLVCTLCFFAKAPYVMVCLLLLLLFPFFLSLLLLLLLWCVGSFSFFSSLLMRLCCLMFLSFRFPCVWRVCTADSEHMAVSSRADL